MRSVSLSRRRTGFPCPLQCTVERKNRQFIELTSKLDAMSPLKVLTRGYAVVRREDGMVLKSVRQMEPGEPIKVSLSDGSLTAAVTEKENAE